MRKLLTSPTPKSVAHGHKGVQAAANANNRNQFLRQRQRRPPTPWHMHACTSTCMPVGRQACCSVCCCASHTHASVKQDMRVSLPKQESGNHRPGQGQTKLGVLGVLGNGPTARHQAQRVFRHPCTSRRAVCCVLRSVAPCQCYVRHARANHTPQSAMAESSSAVQLARSQGRMHEHCLHRPAVWLLTVSGRALR